MNPDLHIDHLLGKRFGVLEVGVQCRIAAKLFAFGCVVRNDGNAGTECASQSEISDV